MADLKERIGERIKTARDAKGWKQVDLARALPGRVEASSVSRWERGKVKPEDDTLEVIADLLDVDVSYFYVEEPQPGTADLMGSLRSGDPTQLDRIELMLRELLEIVRRRDGGDPLQLAEALQDLPGRDTPPVERRGVEAPSRRRRAG